MREASSGSISRIVRTEVGRLKGTPGVMILRVEHLPLAEDASDTRPEVTVFVMDHRQASVLEEQILESFGTFDASPFDPESRD